METSQPDRPRRRLFLVASAAGWWIGFYLYVLLRLVPELFYQVDSRVFLFESSYVRGFLEQPGGPVDFASAFLSPLFAYGWLGAAVVTLLTALICLATRYLFAAVTGTGGRFAFLIPMVLMVLLLGRYSHPVRPGVGLLVVLAFANGFVRIEARRPAVWLMMFLISSVLVYSIAAGFYVVFALSCGVFEWSVRRRRGLGAVAISCAAVIPVTVGMGLCALGVSDAYRGWGVPSVADSLAMPSSLGIAVTIQAGLLLFAPVAGMVLSWGRSVGDLPEPPTDSCDAQEFAVPAVPATARPTSVAFAAIRALVLAAWIVVADLAAFDSPQKHWLQMVSSADRQRWSEVLEHARRIPPLNAQITDLGGALRVIRTVFHVNRALFFTGRLLDDMFCHAQVPDAPTLTLRFSDLSTQARQVPLESSDVLFDLGLINESEHMAHEALEVLGERPRTLERLVYIHVLKDHPEAARRFLAFLERSLLHRRWARGLLRQLEADPTLSAVPAVASRRKLMAVEDLDGQLDDLETVLKHLLSRNRHNRMAFEYLLAHYLLTRQLDEVVANLDRFDDFGDPHLPRHCEEALAIYLESNASQAAGPVSRAVGSETQRRCREFMQRRKLFRGDTAGASAALYRDYGATYFFFYAFGRNDLTYGQSRTAE